jgi:hypothetical protein
MRASFFVLDRKSISQKRKQSEKGKKYWPLKDKLLLQGPDRGFFAAEDPHFYTSIFMVCPMNAKVMPK